MICEIGHSHIGKPDLINVCQTFDKLQRFDYDGGIHFLQLIDKHSHELDNISVSEMPGFVAAIMAHIFLVDKGLQTKTSIYDFQRNATYEPEDIAKYTSPLME